MVDIYSENELLHHLYHFGITVEPHLDKKSSIIGLFW